MLSSPRVWFRKIRAPLKDPPLPLKILHSFFSSLNLGFPIFCDFREVSLKQLIVCRSHFLRQYSFIEVMIWIDNITCLVYEFSKETIFTLFVHYFPKYRRILACAYIQIKVHAHISWTKFSQAFQPWYTAKVTWINPS